MIKKVGIMPGLNIFRTIYYDNKMLQNILLTSWTDKIALT